MNVAMHAFAPGEPGEITVRLSTSPDAAALVVEDSGHPFDPTAAPSPRAAGEPGRSPARRVGPHPAPPLLPRNHAMSGSAIGTG